MKIPITKRLRREFFESLGLIVVGVMVVLSTVLNIHDGNAVEDRFRDCMVDQITKVSAAVNARTEASADSSESLNMVIVEISSATSDKDVSLAFQRFLKKQAAIEDRNEQDPIPPFPNGECEL